MERKMNIHKPHLNWIILFIIGSTMLLSGCASSKETASMELADKVENKFSITVEDKKTLNQDLYKTPISLEHYLKYAALNNPGLQSAFYNWKAALHKIPQARALMDPKFSYTYYIGKVETKVGPQKQKFGIAQAIPWFGTLSLKGGITWEKRSNISLT